MLEQALEYAKRELPVFPCKGKLPLTEHGCKDATCAPDQICRWWEANPVFNIAVATGKGIAVLDVDPDHGGDESLRDLLDEHGDVATAVVETGGGGLHYWFRVPDGVEVRNSAGNSARAWMFAATVAT